MPALDKSFPALHLLTPPYRIYIAQYPIDQKIPDSVWSGGDREFLSVTRAPGEITVVFSIVSGGNGGSGAGGQDEVVQKDAVALKVLAQMGLPKPREIDGSYGVLRVKGPLDLSEYSSKRPARSDIGP